MYIGQAKNLRVRVGQYLTRERKPTGRPKIRRFLYKYDAFIWFGYSELAVNDLDNVESALISAYLPPLNTRVHGTVGAAQGALR